MHDRIDLCGCNAPPVGCDEECRLHGDRSTHGKVVADHRGEPAAYGYQPLFIAFAEHLDLHQRKIDIRSVEIHQLGTSHAGLIEHIDNELVTHLHKAVRRHGIEQTFEVGIMHDLRETLGFAQA